MRITDTVSKNEIWIGREEGDSDELTAIALRLMPEWLRLFARKNADYGSGSSFDLGVRGQYSDIHRKMIKLRRALWDGESLAFEGVDEIINDLIGHLFLTRRMLEMKDEAEREYAYNEEDAAVDAFIRMVGGDYERAYKMADMLTPPFGELVKAKAKERLDANANEQAAKFIHHTIVRKQKADARLAEFDMLGDDDKPRLMSREVLFAGLKPGQRVTAESLNKPKLVSPYATLASEEFGEADQEQHVGLVPIKVGDAISISGLPEVDGDHEVVGVSPSCSCHDNHGYSMRPLRDDDPVHPQDAEDDGPPAYIDAIPDISDLAEFAEGMSEEMQAEVKPILDKLFKNSDKQRELLSKFERKIRGY